MNVFLGLDFFGMLHSPKVRKALKNGWLEGILVSLGRLKVRVQ